jgi:hypothetical protein
VNYSTAVSNAQSDLAEFWGILPEYEKDTEGIKTRIFNEKMAKVLQNIGTVRMVESDENGDGSKIFIDWGKK